ncbi:type II secretion system F family protein [Alkaliphilus transvaalensis]|uniref:type II secretion system F family protein n=1 Tax=Alkaliphilus transvaalensis TaxID=114628 RepID=UPI00047CE312|nr:hypothetical protein [Alkaliphilus transvaalensis]
MPLFYRLMITLSMLILLVTISKLIFNFDIVGLFVKVDVRDKRIKNYSDILKEQRRREILNSKPGLKERVLKRVTMAIELSEVDLSISQFITYSLLFSSIGVFIGLFLRNPILMVILGGLTSLLPFVFIHNKAKSKFALIDELLPTVMGIIIAQYLHETDIIIAIEKKLEQIPAPLNRHFTSCINEVQVLNKDTVTALKNLGDKIENYYFNEFIKLAIQAEEQGQNLKFTMVSIPEDMRDVQQEQSKFDLIRKKYNREFIATIVFMPINLMLLRFGYRDYYNLLVYDVRGKISLGIIAIGLIIVSYKQYMDNKPIKIEID